MCELHILFQTSKIKVCTVFFCDIVLRLHQYESTKGDNNQSSRIILIIFMSFTQL